MNDYKEYLKNWLSGIPSEIRFWNTLMRTEGNSIGSPEMFRLRISPNTPFFLEPEIEKENTSFLDIGSGPFSNCGFLTDSPNFHFYAVDPLAQIYAQLKDKYHIVSPVAPVTGMVEILGEQFEEGTFDIVHMSNALDHCFDPLCGIMQMLYICKTGGKIILRHNENEAEKNNYNGLHQWNAALEDGQFILWRESVKINVSEHLKDLAVIETAEMAHEITLGSDWPHNKFVIRKLKNFRLEDNRYRSLIVTSFLEEICKLNLMIQQNQF